MKQAAQLIILALIATGSTTVLAKSPPERSAKATAALEKALAGRVAGKPQGCIPLNEFRNIRIIDRNTILAEGTGGRIWRNDLGGGCPGLSSDLTIVTKSSLPQHCRGDIFRVVDTAIPATFSACGFGDFVPYTKVKQAK